MFIHKQKPSAEQIQQNLTGSRYGTMQDGPRSHRATTGGGLVCPPDMATYKVGYSDHDLAQDAQVENKGVAQSRRGYPGLDSISQRELCSYPLTIEFNIWKSIPSKNIEYRLTGQREIPLQVC